MSDTQPQVEEFIVVAEDSAPNRNILVHLLKRIGYKVLDFDNGKKAWEGLQANLDKNIVAVLSDIMMPEMSGIELLRHIRNHDKVKDIPVVLITAVTEKEYIAESKELKVNGYILKPVTADRIRTKFKELFPHKVFATKLAS
jgi:two-component system, chemotaxis family, chemotaxis protein CheY